MAKEHVEASEEFIGPERRGVAAEDVPDRRQHPRYAIDAWAEVIVLDGSLLFRGRVLDISLAGCFIQTEARLHMRQRTPVEIVFRLNESVFRITATSRMVRPGIGAGFLFAEMSERTRLVLDALIAELGAAD
ncbi:hypothetical protein GCM10011507_24850 [Edaphobacter acidisoli]|uniref:PilZ domain-containing protein n=1 Tax=Edaphobacter acidisoli TaxID=2040573 RepID=A0A916RXJ5_9BACT|nr:PilZ domain-containing protein [Edaphobacter acidisoli]GGA72264.1 hypothetical protein GCM10011507_24850 [Edaphobacter acidisoli]